MNAKNSNSGHRILNTHYSYICVCLFIGKNKKLNRLFDIDDDKEEFNIPDGLDLELKCNPVQAYDLTLIKYTDDFQSFVDVSIIGILIYAATEIYAGFFHASASNEINLSMVWCSVIILYGVTALASIALNYLRSSDEASLLYIFASLSFILSLLIQLGDTKFFDFHLKDAFRNFTYTAHQLLDQVTSQIVGANSPADKNSDNIYSKLKHYSTNELLFTCFIAACSALIGALLFFPSFRLARLHFLCIKYSQESRFKVFLFYLNFLLPLFVSLCWFRPVNRTANAAIDENSQVMHID